MYETALVIHNALRWVAILAVLLVFLRAMGGSMSSRKINSGDRFAGLFATIVVDVQFLLGLLLYLVWSPQTKTAMQDFGAAMKNPELRFWAVEHAAVMILAVVFVHLGKIFARRATSDASKQRRTAVWFFLALVLMVLRTPWPGMEVARPWIRM
ncbi:MAG: hypothetical protein JNL28_00765 [Planctomycetes bacterium]|nr:hypothetical protein [Planctomycetota bacterium]